MTLKKVLNSTVGDLGSDALEYTSRTKGPFIDMVVGMESVDRSREWRIDWDESKGAHINWWNGKQKGAITFTGDLEQAKRIVDNKVL